MPKSIFSQAFQPDAFTSYECDGNHGDDANDAPAPPCSALKLVVLFLGSLEGFQGQLGHQGQMINYAKLYA